jgi:hypothetical protein
MNPTVELLKVKALLSNNEKQIKENDILNLLGEELPEINIELEKLSNPQNVYTSVKCFAEFTKSLVNKGNFSEVKHCFNIAEKMMLEGNKTVKNAIENVYIFSMSTILDLTSPISYKIKDMMNRSLWKEYSKQVNASGI